MPVTVKNPSLKRKVFNQMNRYDSLAEKEYKKGNIRKGRIYEKKSDNVYDINYNKIFKVTKFKKK